MATGRSHAAPARADESTGSTLALIVAVIQYRRLLRHLWQPGFRVLAGLEEGKALYAPTLLVTWMLILIGIFASAVVILRVP